MKILIYGVHGSGKTSIAEPFAKLINGVYLNEHSVYSEFPDLDLTDELEKAKILHYYSRGIEHVGLISVIDAVCPTQQFRDIINPDYTVWMDTVKSIDKFEKPQEVDYHVSEWFTDTPNQLLEVVTHYIK